MGFIFRTVKKSFSNFVLPLAGRRTFLLPGQSILSNKYRFPDYAPRRVCYRIVVRVVKPDDDTHTRTDERNITTK